MASLRQQMPLTLSSITLLAFWGVPKVSLMASENFNSLWNWTPFSNLSEIWQQGSPWVQSLNISSQLDGKSRSHCLTLLRVSQGNEGMQGTNEIKIKQTKEEE